MYIQILQGTDLLFLHFRCLAALISSTLFLRDPLYTRIMFDSSAPFLERAQPDEGRNGQMERRIGTGKYCSFLALQQHSK